MADLSGHLGQPDFFCAAFRTPASIIVRHLLADCPECRRRLDQLGGGPWRLGPLLGLPMKPEEGKVSADDYSQAFGAVDQALGAFFATGKPAERALEELMAELAPLSPDEQTHSMSHHSRFASPQLAQHLVDLSQASRYESPARMVHLADLARLAAEACTVEAAGSAQRLADCRARAWGQYGNSLRVSGRLAEAEEAFAKARQLWTEGTGDPPLRARLQDQTASLYISRRRFSEAIELAHEAGHIYRELGETQAYAGTLVQKAIALLHVGNDETVARILHLAIRLIDGDRDPRLKLVAFHNLARCYIDLERPEQALAVYSKAKALYRQFSDPLIMLRAAWKEGQLLRDLGHLVEAEEALLCAFQGFLKQDLFFEATLVFLDLASVSVKLGKAADLRLVGVMMMPIFVASGIDRGVLASLLRFLFPDTVPPKL